MLLRTISLSAILVLGLAACDSQETAEAPPEDANETALAPDTTTTTPEVTTASPDASDTTTPEVTTLPPDSGIDPDTVASINAPIDPYLGQTYSGGPISLQLNRDNTFVMNQVEGNQNVEGQYSYENGVLTFSQPSGDVGSANFPLTCRMEPAGADGFALQDEEQGENCGPLKNLTFRPAA